MKDSLLGQYLESNPVSYAHPKAPKPYQTRSAKFLTEEQVFALLHVVGAKARAGDLVGKRDYALLLLYITTGMRRNEVMSLRGKEVIVEEKRIIIRGRVKGGDYQGREVTDRRVRAALLDYLRSGRRLHVLREDQPLWTRHDGAGEPGAQLSSWSFVENLKRYVREAGIGKIHLHQTRHTFARLVAKRSGIVTLPPPASMSIASRSKPTSTVNTSSKPWNCRTSKAISLWTLTPTRSCAPCQLFVASYGIPYYHKGDGKSGRTNRARAFSGHCCEGHRERPHIERLSCSAYRLYERR
jgi:integrase